MPIKLISLVFLFISLIINKAIAEEKFILPVEKPSIFKNIKKKINEKEESALPQKKPILKVKEKIKIINEKNDQDKKDTEKKVKNEDKTKISKLVFIFPKKKPVTYKVTSKTTEKSTILNDKDFSRAKETIKFIKAKKWNSALKSADKIKDRDFKNLITWMYLKTTGNTATFNDYKKFIERNSNYPRINRIKYLAEKKIYLRNMSPTSVINWFEKNPPLGGIGKIKLAEAYLEQNKIEIVEKLVKEGWTTAEISKNDLGYYRAKFKKFLSNDDHLKRADYLAWEKLNLLKLF